MIRQRSVHIGDTAVSRQGGLTRQPSILRKVNGFNTDYLTDDPICLQPVLSTPGFQYLEDAPVSRSRTLQRSRSLSPSRYPRNCPTRQFVHFYPEIKRGHNSQVTESKVALPFLLTLSPKLNGMVTNTTQKQGQKQSLDIKSARSQYVGSVNSTVKPILSSASSGDSFENDDYNHMENLKEGSIEGSVTMNSSQRPVGNKPLPRMMYTKDGPQRHSGYRGYRDPQSHMATSVGSQSRIEDRQSNMRATNSVMPSSPKNKPKSVSFAPDVKFVTRESRSRPLLRKSPSDLLNLNIMIEQANQLPAVVEKYMIRSLPVIPSITASEPHHQDGSANIVYIDGVRYKDPKKRDSVISHSYYCAGDYNSDEQRPLHSPLKTVFKDRSNHDVIIFHNPDGCTMQRKPVHSEKISLGHKEMPEKLSSPLLRTKNSSMGGWKGTTTINLPKVRGHTRPSTTNSLECAQPIASSLVVSQLENVTSPRTMVTGTPSTHFLGDSINSQESFQHISASSPVTLRMSRTPDPTVRRSQYDNIPEGSLLSGSLSSPAVSFCAQ